MARTATPTHYISGNKASRVPRTHIILDAESVIAETAKGEVHTFRVAVTSIDRMPKNGTTWMPTEYATHLTPADVWQWIDAHAKPRARTVVVAHNAGYDLRITDALTQLETLGYQLVTLSLMPGATFGTWRKDTTTICVVDSMTWLPTSLDRIGTLVGVNKQRLPDQQDCPELWEQRCQIDVEILRAAWMRIIMWCRETDVGNWRPTGAGTAWSYWRHKHYTHKVLVHDVDDVRVLERRAAWTGRAEAWRRGKLTGGPWQEWDYSCAYARIAMSCNVPTRLRGEIRGAGIERSMRGASDRAILATVRVTTDLPCVPASHGKLIAWPTGTFDTVLWDHEIRMARANGATVTPIRAWSYIAEPALQQWATEILGIIDDTKAGDDQIIRTLCKHWSRSLIGRFGSRFSTWEHFGVAPVARMDLSTMQLPEDTERRRMLTIGRNVMVATDETDAPDSAPQIMSWIMAEARVRLWHAMTTAGLDNLAYCDTDCVIVNREGADRLRQAAIPDLRIKATYQQLEVLATRRIITDGQLRASGIPKGAVRTADGLWSAEVWQGLSASLQTGKVGSVNITRKTMRISSVDNRRKPLPAGRTTAFVRDDPPTV